MEQANTHKRFNESTGHDWCKKRNAKGSHRSETKGSQKGENCKAGPLDRYMCKRNRSYKHLLYKAWSDKKR